MPTEQQPPMFSYEQQQPSPQNAPQQPGPSQKVHKPWYKKVWVWLLILIVLAGFGQIAKKPSKESTSSTNSQSSSSATGQSAAPGTSQGDSISAGIGSPITSGPFELTVTKVEPGLKELGKDPITTKAQGQFVIVSLSAKNIDKKAEYLSSAYVKLLSADGTEYSVTDSASIYLGQEATLFSQINPGNTLEGKMAFDIPAEAKPTTLQFSGGFFEKAVKISLG